MTVSSHVMRPVLLVTACTTRRNVLEKMCTASTWCDLDSLFQLAWQQRIGKSAALLAVKIPQARCLPGDGCCSDRRHGIGRADHVDDRIGRAWQGCCQVGSTGADGRRREDCNLPAAVLTVPLLRPPVGISRRAAARPWMRPCCLRTPLCLRLFGQRHARAASDIQFKTAGGSAFATTK